MGGGGGKLASSVPVSRLQWYSIRIHLSRI